MTDRGDWSNRPPGTDSDFVLESYSNSDNLHSSKHKDRNVKIPENKLEKIGSTHGSSSYHDKLKKDKSHRRSYSRSPKRKDRRSRSSSSSKSRSYGKNRRRYNSSSSSERRSSRSHSKEKSRYKNQSHSNPSSNISSRNDREKFKSRSRDRSRSSRSSSSDSRSRRRKSYKKADYNHRRKHLTNSRHYNNSGYSYRKDYPPSGHYSNTNKSYTKATQSEANVNKTTIPFKNDGSFLEMFKKMQEAQKPTTQSTSANSEMISPTEDAKKPAVPLVGKRRGGRVLKTGMVKKTKTIEEQTVDSNPLDAWSLYLQEVKKYKETSCEEEGKTRPLVK